MTRDTSRITAAEFERWLASSDPGARIVYATGFLAKSIGSGDGEDTWGVKGVAKRDA